eukprot:NODE_385_length_8329_cov_0.434386.p7 type:complete len:116 gc:universal NODE_385_length_8329_cov_0.434386:8054-7707(-)
MTKHVMVKDYCIMAKSYIEKSQIYNQFFQNEELLERVITTIRVASRAIGITEGQFCTVWETIATHIGTPHVGSKVETLLRNDDQITSLNTGLDIYQVRSAIRSLYDTNDKNKQFF